jgi:GntR family transcriptional repressor for pyruvate dehydrogenase complex
MGTQRLYRGPRSAVFAPLESQNRTELVTDRLADAIVLGLLSDAEQLPSETELAARLGVSTVTIREALTALRGRGLVETRRGRGGGSFVRAPGEGTHEHDRLHSRLRELSPGELRDVGDHWGAVAGAAARLAAQRADSDDVERLSTAAERLAVARTPGDRRRADGHFHIEVAAAGQSARLTRAEITLQTEAGALCWLVFEDAKPYAEALGRCRRLIGAIRDGDAALAGELGQQRVVSMLEHLIGLRLRLSRV